jgi:hypothetical protein
MLAIADTGYIIGSVNRTTEEDTMTAMDYRETSRILQAEGFSTDDIDAAIDSLIDTGIEYADEDELLLTEDEVQVLRDQLGSSQAGEDRDRRDAENDEVKAEYEAGMRGPGRPEIGRMVNVRMPADMIAALDAQRSTADLSRAEVIRAIVASALGADAPDAGIRW